MATAEAASAAAGPRYAPEDPTLPKPWKALIDGSTGVTYYWNPETNVTQYERPVSVTSSVPSMLPSAASTPQPAQTQFSQTMPSNNMFAQAAEATHQQPHYSNPPSHQHAYPQGLSGGQQIHQQASLVPPAGKESQSVQGFPQSQSKPGQGMLPSGSTLLHQGQVFQQQFSQHVGPPAGQQAHPQGSHLGQQVQGQQMPQLAFQQPHQQAVHPTPQQMSQQIPQYQGHQMGQQVGQQFTMPQMNYPPYQQAVPVQGQQNTQPQPQHATQSPNYPYKQEHNIGSQQDDVNALKRNQSMFSPPQSDRVGTVAIQPSPSASSHMVQSSGASNPPQSIASSMHMPHHNSSMTYKPETEMIYQQRGPLHQNQMDPALMRGQLAGFPHPGSNMGYGQHPQGRSGNDYHYNANKEAPGMASQDPKLAKIPIGSNQQEMRLSGFLPQGMPPGSAGGSSAVSAHGMPNMYQGNLNMAISNHASGTVLPIQPGPAGSVNVTSADAYRQQHEVTATGDNVPPPFMTFEAAGFPPEILREIHRAGFPSPTPIQAQTWPISLQGRDIVAIAKTGSGKTLGYLIPAFLHLRQRHNNPLNGPTVLVLAPTRELATQIQDEAIKFGQSSRISCTCLYGGAPKGPQLKELERGADIVVATPGRLNDILEMRKVDFRQVSLLVLDEADRMLDMGFEPQIRKIVNEIPPRRQTLMYTATWPKEVRKIASELLNNPVQVNIGNVDELAANKSITQYVEVVPQMEKQRRLEQILMAEERGAKVIVFCSTKKLCDDLTRTLRRNFGAAAIHGDKTQGERDWVLNQFRSGKSPILVATDVAARGLDVKDIRVVINYDFPTGIEDYVHRIGRTGRAGATGVAYTFLSEQDWKYAPDLIKVLEGANQQVPPKLREMAVQGPPAFGRDRGGMNRFDSHSGGGRWDSGGRGGPRDGGFGRGGPRDGGFGGFRDGGRGDGFGGRGDMRDNFGGRGGIRDNFSGRGGRGDVFLGRGGRGGRDFGGPRGGGGRVGWGRDDRGPNDRFGRDGFGRGRGRGRFDSSRRDGPSGRSSRGRSPSPERVRTWGGYSRSPSRSWSRSRSRSRSRSWSRGYSRSRSPRRSYSRDRSRSRSLSRDRNRSRSPNYGSYRRPGRQDPDQKDALEPNLEEAPVAIEPARRRRKSGFDVAPLALADPTIVAPADVVSAEQASSLDAAAPQQEEHPM